MFDDLFVVLGIEIFFEVPGQRKHLLFGFPLIKASILALQAIEIDGPGKLFDGHMHEGSSDSLNFALFLRP
jgi:hypothetical protein